MHGPGHGKGTGQDAADSPVGRGQASFVYSSKNEERNNALALKDYLLKKF